MLNTMALKSAHQIIILSSLFAYATGLAIDNTSTNNNDKNLIKPSVDEVVHYNVDNRDNSIEGAHQLGDGLSWRQDPRRPVWNLAHMVNSIKELDYRIG